MNPTSRKARTLVALCSTAALTAGGVLVANPANAVADVTLDPAAPATVNVPNVGAAIAGNALAQPLANATLAVTATTVLAGHDLQIDLTAAPVGGTFYFSQQAEAPTGPATGWTTLTTATSPSATLSGATPTVYVTADVPGTYTFNFVDVSDADTSAALTLNVLDVMGNTGATGDDWNPAVSAPATADIGAPVLATVALAGLTGTDARGADVLLAAISRLVGVEFAGTLGVTVNPVFTVPGAVDADGDRRLPLGEMSGTGTLTSTAVFDTTGNGVGAEDAAIGTADTTTVSSNDVTGVTAAAPPVVGAVKQTDSAVAVRTGTATVTYTATVAPAAAGDTVYFTLGGDDVASLTTNGTLVDPDNHVFSAPTVGAGVATITVTSAVTAAGDTYTVRASSNGQNSDTLTATYAAPVVDRIVITNSEAQLSPPTAQTSVVLTGALRDQFGAAIQPAGSPQVTVEIPTGTVAGTVPVTASAFAYTYTPATTPSIGDVVPFRFVYGAASISGVITWISNTRLTVTAPAQNATGVVLASSGTVAPDQTASTFGNGNAQVTGTVTNAAGVPQVGAAVTITGSEGVYFALAANGSGGLTTTRTVNTAVGGTFGGVYAIFTKTGAATITVSVGDASETRSLTVAAATDAYAVTIENVTGRQGSTAVVTGTVKDAFGNPVTATTVNLTMGSSTLGALTTASATTNAEGVFTTTMTLAGDQTGTATLTATINGQAANRTATAWAATGVTVAEGDYQDAATVTVTAETVTISAPASRVGAGTVTITGTTTANRQVRIYSRPTVAESAFGWRATATASGLGAFTVTLPISAPTTFVARTDAAISAEDSTEIVTLTGPAQRTGAGTVTISGVAVPGVVVTIRQRPYGEATFTEVGTATADTMTGAFSMDVPITTHTTFDARSANAVISPQLTVQVQGVVAFTTDNKALGGGRFQISVRGTPSVAGGAMSLFEWRDGAWARITTLRDLTQGLGTYTWTTTPGTRTIRVHYSAPGLLPGSASTRITVT